LNILSNLWAVYRLRQQFYKWDEATLRQHQAKKVKKLLIFAKAKSPYYQRRLSDIGELSLEKVPEIDKTEMMAHFDEINTGLLYKEDLINFQLKQEKASTLGLYRGRYSVGVSSGTSGNKGLTVLSKNERDNYSCLLWARNGIPNHVKNRRVFFALRNNNPAFMQVRSFGIQIFYVDYTHPIGDYINLINDNKLNILAGPPSLLMMIANMRAGISHKIESIISYAEVLDEATKFFLEKTFDSPVSQIYQGSEGFVGSTCRNGNLHLNEDVILVELTEAGDAIGRAKNVVVTDLYRTTQPIIRYALNDILEISDKPCPCGSCFRVIDKIHGRADDIFYLRCLTGEKRFLFPDYVQRSIIHASDDIIEYQAIQKSMDVIEIRLVLKDHSNRVLIEESIINNLKFWALKAGGELGAIQFSNNPPERNPRSNKMIRVIRAF
jgi:putative adenylate-forming enzyme